MNNWKLGGVFTALVTVGLFGWWQISTPLSAQEAAATTGAKSATKPGAGQQAPGTAKAGAASGRSAQGGKAGGRPGRGGGRPPALVVVQPVEEALINDRLKAVGSGMAKASVSVVPFSGGQLSEVLITSGQTVQKNALLARLDDEEQLIARDRAARDVENAAIDEARLAKLFRSRTASEVDLIRARADLADAKLTLRNAELTLARRSIRAPIAGSVGLVSVDVGNYVSPQTEIVTIDDRSTIVVEFWVPERFSGQVVAGQTVEATSQANPASPHIGTITGIGSRIDINSRTLPVQAELNNDDDNLRPGMAFNLSLNFTGQSYPAVNPLAIQWDSRGSFVWIVAEGKVKRVPVQIIQRNPESVLVAAELPAGANVVTEGVLALRPGAAVRVQGAKPEAQKARPDSASDSASDGARGGASDGSGKSADRGEKKKASQP